MEATLDRSHEAATPAGSTHDEAARCARLVEWLTANGARLDGLVITDCAGERGVRAASDAAEGQTLAVIPQALFITSEAARQSRVGQRLAALSPEAPDRAHLALHLLALSREDSFWQPYIDILPRAFPGHPLYYGPAELLMLEPRTAVGGMIKSVIDGWREAAAQVAPVLAEEGFTAEEFRWAFTCVRTRAYSIGGEDSNAVAMIPLADMLNHAADHATLGKRPERSDYVISAVRGIGVGDEVTATYGKFGNVSLLAVYGFGLEENPYDGAFLILNDHPHEVSRRYGDDKVQNMFRQVRMATPGLPGSLSSLDGNAPCGAEHEFACLQRIHHACESALDRHTSCLVDDDPLRAQVDPRSGLGRLLAALAAEKAVLWHWMLMTTTAGRVLGARAGEGQDMALLRYLDADYAAQIAALLQRDQDRREAAATTDQRQA